MYLALVPGGQGTAPYRSNLDATVLFDTGLAAGSTYYYQVAAVNAGGLGPRTIEVGGTAAGSQASVPAAPANLQATAGLRRVDLGWNPVSGATSYNLYRSTAPNGQGTTPLRSGLSATSFANTSLSNGTTYYYKVSAVNGSGKSPRSTETSATPSR